MKMISLRKKTKLEIAIDSVLDKMSKLEPNSDEYTDMANNLEKLLKAKSYVKSKGISSDTMLVVAGNLLGIALILGYEKANIITTKALSFVLKGRV